MTKTSGKLPATLIPGDGIGPEIVKSAVDILEALGSRSSGKPARAAWPPSRKAMIRCRSRRSTASGAPGWH